MPGTLTPRETTSAGQCESARVLQVHNYSKNIPDSDTLSAYDLNAPTVWPSVPPVFAPHGRVVAHIASLLQLDEDQHRPRSGSQV